MKCQVCKGAIPKRKRNNFTVFCSPFCRSKADREVFLPNKERYFTTKKIKVI